MSLNVFVWPSIPGNTNLGLIFASSAYSIVYRSLNPARSANFCDITDVKVVRDAVNPQAFASGTLKRQTR